MRGSSGTTNKKSENGQKMLPVPLRLCQGWLQTCPSQGCLPVLRDTIQHDIIGQLFCPVRDNTSRDLNVEQQTRHKIMVTC